jgi:glycosyltransferase involved in cell wall biosynthesis
MRTVSVIMPAYNVARYLAESIDSALAQTYRDFEIVIVNDGSTDTTLAIAERYCRRHPDRIVLVSQANRGLAGARNTALGVARGEVFALLDSDDTWLPTFLAEQMRILDAEPGVAIVTGNAFNRGGPEDGLPVRPVDDRRPLPNLVEILRDETAVFIMSVFRREVFDTIGGFDERFRTNEDYDFWIRAALAGFRFARNPTPLGQYRRHASSLSASEVRMIAGILRVFRKTLPCCEPGSPARQVAEQQIERFDAELLMAQARAALDEGDAAAAVIALDALRRRRSGLTLALVAHALRRVPRVAVWMYRARRRRLVDAKRRNERPVI